MTETEDKKKDSFSFKKGCSLFFILINLLIFLGILTMCSVPKEKYKPYLSAGEEYYKEVLEISPKISHRKYYADEGGGFSIKVQFKPEQMQGNLVKLYTKNQTEYSFRATSVESQTVGISKKAIKTIEQANGYSEYNKPVSEMLNELLEIDNPDSELFEKSNHFRVNLYSTDLLFWKKVLSHYEELKKKTFNERFEWFTKQVDKNTFFCVRVDVYGGAFLFDTLKDDNLPVKNFPVGTIFIMKSEFDNERVIYESDETFHLIKSQNDYPVSY